MFCINKKLFCRRIRISYSEKTCKASVLASVMIVAVLMLLVVSGLIVVREHYDSAFYRLQEQKQQQMWLDSGFLFYCRDTAGQLRDTAGYVLFPEDKRSRIRVEAKPWGLYEAVTVTVGRTSSVRLLGMAQSARLPVLLYACDRGGIFSLAGRTQIEGKACLPAAGVSYTAVRSEFFDGTPLPVSRISRSGKELPALQEEVRQRVTDCYRLEEGVVWTAPLPEYWKQPFGESTLIFPVGGEIKGKYSGNVILYSETPVYLGEECRLDAVLMVAPSVVIGPGFQGSLQVFARDTVVVREGAELEYPSGIYLLSANPQRRVEIKEHAWVNGYVIVDGERRITQKREINYRQALTARVRGLVYVDGIAQVQGIIAGALYVKDSYYFSESGYYSGLLYNAVLLENPEMIWPFWLEGCPERRVIRWLE